MSMKRITLALAHSADTKGASEHMNMDILWPRPSRWYDAQRDSASSYVRDDRARFRDHRCTPQTGAIGYGGRG